ncbi:DUF6106 family protein [Clostridiaceae bacterium OttesenSCG-928-D20]|nr:DUF6106 family protein [Clostridiaceae bacterium OttesenSCG-928-D20]
MRYDNSVFEEIVTRGSRGKNRLIKLLIYFATFIFIAVINPIIFNSISFMQYIAPALNVLVIFLGVFYLPGLVGVEYEYCFISGDVDIDKIIGQKRRKKCLSFNVRNVELVAPCDSGHKNKLEAKYDFKLDARGEGIGPKDWMLICRDDNNRHSLLVFNPSSRILEALRQSVRRGAFSEY